MKAITELNERIRVDVRVISAVNMEFRGDYGKGISVKLIWSANNGVLSYIKVIFNGIAPLLKSTAVMFGLAGYKSLLLAIMARMMGKKLFLRTSLIGYDDAHSITGQFK